MPPDGHDLRNIMVSVRHPYGKERWGQHFRTRTSSALDLARCAACSMSSRSASWLWLTGAAGAAAAAGAAPAALLPPFPLPPAPAAATVGRLYTRTILPGFALWNGGGTRGLLGGATAGNFLRDMRFWWKHVLVGPVACNSLLFAADGTFAVDS